jgi:uncharacterized Zn finger protein (UPF0148 family)
MKAIVKVGYLKDGGEFMLEAVCGKCKGVLYGYDEVICPCCGCDVEFE